MRKGSCPEPRNIPQVNEAEANEVKSSNTTTARNVFFSTQGSKTPHPLNKDGKGITEIFDDHKGDRLGWCSSERDKWDVLYSVYGRSNVRFAN